MSSVKTFDDKYVTNVLDSRNSAYFSIFKFIAWFVT